MLAGGVQVRDQEEVFPLHVQPAAPGLLDHLVLQGPEHVPAVGVLEQLRVEIQALLERVLVPVVLGGPEHTEHGVPVRGYPEDAVVGLRRQLLQLPVRHIIQRLEHLVVELGVGDVVLLHVALPGGAAMPLEELPVLLPAGVVLPELELGFGEDDLDALRQDIVLLSVDIPDQSMVDGAVPAVRLPDELVEREGGQQALDPGSPYHEILAADGGQDHAAAVGVGDGHVHLLPVDLEVVRGDVVHQPMDVGLEVVHHDTPVNVEVLPQVRGAVAQCQVGQVLVDVDAALGVDPLQGEAAGQPVPTPLPEVLLYRHEFLGPDLTGGGGEKYVSLAIERKSVFDDALGHAEEEHFHDDDGVVEGVLPHSQGAGQVRVKDAHDISFIQERSADFSGDAGVVRDLGLQRLLGGPSGGAEGLFLLLAQLVAALPDELPQRLQTLLQDSLLLGVEGGCL